MSKTDCKFNFLVFFEEPLNATTWLTLPKGYMVGCQKTSLLYPRTLGFSLLFKNKIDAWFFMM
jgi:hypothetical protein